jgi:nitroreductase / dihydropteridine reductase
MEKLPLQEAINWRYATKRMTGEKISSADLEQILDAIQLAPTSRGLQSFKVLIINNDELKKKIQPIADNQPQVVECSHLLVFAAWKSVNENQINDFIQYVADERGIPIEKLEKMKSMLIKDQLPMSSDDLYYWTSKQIYIALGFGITTAATLKVDAAALEGFSPIELDNLLGLDKLGLRSVVLLALGFRNVETDWLVKLKKVRRTKEELFLQIDTFTQ